MLLVHLGFQQCMPPADLLALAVLHFLPVLLFLLPTAVLAQGNPANHLFALHSAPAINRNHQGNIRELEESNLEDKGLFIDRIGLATPNGRLAAGHLLTHTVEKEEFSICIYRKSKQEKDEKPSGLCTALSCHLHIDFPFLHANEEGPSILQAWSLLLDHHILHILLRKRIVALCLLFRKTHSLEHSCST